jgi:ABC-type polysaccharide/polyol phosphate transport system ATPase subunit
MIDLALDRVYKKYKLRRKGNWPKRWYRGLVERPVEMWALQDVSFEVKQGEALGIVGHNGAGKTTILKLLSSITVPTRGHITIRGRLAALIEVGSGFHPELTGRENVFLHGAMLGMRRSEIARKMDSIVDFSGVEKYIDEPVKRYSSGMNVRLGFSVAAHLEPDIVLLDEVLAVGDVAFQTKCLDRISELRKNGGTIVFVSHDLASIYRLCDRAILLDRGRVLMDGPPRLVVDSYQKMTFGDHESLAESQRDPGKAAECLSVAFSAPDPSHAIRTGYPMVAHLGYRNATAIPNAIFRISVYWPSGYLCAQLSNESSGFGPNLEPGHGEITFECPVLPIQPGLYRVDLAIESGGRELDSRPHCATLCVEAGKSAMGDFYIENVCRVRRCSH